MTTPAFVSAGRRVYPQWAGEIPFYERAFAQVTSTTDALYSGYPSGQEIPILHGVYAGLWRTNGTTSLEFIRDWSTTPLGQVMTFYILTPYQTDTNFWYYDVYSWYGTPEWSPIAVYSWPHSITIPTDAAPAGVATGDQVLMVFETSTADAVYWQQTDGLDDWDFVGEQVGVSGGVYSMIRVFSRRWEAGCLPVTVVTRDTDGDIFLSTNPNDFYTAQLFAFRPSTIGPDTDGGSSDSADPTLDSGTMAVGSSPGVALAFGAQPLGTTAQELTAFDTANGFSEVHRTGARTTEMLQWRSGELVLATRNVAVGELSSTVVGPTWGSPSTRAGVSMSLSLETVCRVTRGDWFFRGEP